MTAFFGTFTNKIDSKGRLSVPAPFRAVLQTAAITGSNQFFVAADYTIELSVTDKDGGMRRSAPLLVTVTP